MEIEDIEEPVVNDIESVEEDKDSSVEAIKTRKDIEARTKSMLVQATQAHELLVELF